jgi:peptide chain release factor 1
VFDKLKGIEEKYENLERLLSSPEVIGDQNQYQKHAKALAEIQDTVNVYRQYKKVARELEEAEAMKQEEQDPELVAMAEAEAEELKEKQTALTERLRLLLLPKDPNDEKNVIVEIRAGAGGDEAGLFAGDLFRMYTRYAEEKNWKMELVDSHPSDIGGFKEIVFMIKGQGAYSKLKYESGVHRVQRIPTTESGGRIHTSTATVAVLPEAEEVDVEIDPNDLRIDIFCSSGPGGQSVNTTQSAVRITHIPSGLVVTCQDEKSQHKNKDKAMNVLRARLMDKIQQEQRSEIDSNRKSQVGTGDRSERIRTYNFPQGRVTDHRIGLTLHKLELVLDGQIDEIIDVLIAADQAEKLKEVD